MISNVEELLVPGAHFGEYEIVRLLGRGGMGYVYLARNPLENTLFAIKILSPEKTGENREFVNRFIREAEFAMTARHPNLVTVFDAGEDPETGLCYLIMEYLAGGSLRDLLAKSRELPVARAVAIAFDIAYALSFVEAQNMVHRDVKPDNVLFNADGVAKLADLGISKFDDEGRNGPPTDTIAGEVIGTPAYMAPEQMVDSHSVDIRADIYSLGVVLYEMLAGRRPNEGENAMRILAKAMRGQRYADVRTLRREVSVPLAELVATMISPAQDERPSSAREVLARLANPDSPRGRASEPVRWHRDTRLVAAIVAVICALSALLVSVTTSRAHRLALRQLAAARTADAAALQPAAKEEESADIEPLGSAWHGDVENQPIFPDGYRGGGHLYDPLRERSMR